MAFIKYKNADGNWESVETPGAIKYISQTLSEDQKEQARSNIGVQEAINSAIGDSVFEVTFYRDYTSKETTCSKTFSEIKSAFDAGKQLDVTFLVRDEDDYIYNTAKMFVSEIHDYSIRFSSNLIMGPLLNPYCIMVYMVDDGYISSGDCWILSEESLVSSLDAPVDGAAIHSYAPSLYLFKTLSDKVDGLSSGGTTNSVTWENVSTTVGSELGTVPYNYAVNNKFKALDPNGVIEAAGGISAWITATYEKAEEGSY